MNHMKIEKKIIKRIISVKKYIFSKNFVKAIVLGQFLSLLICGTALTSGLLQENNVNIPTGQSLLNYVLLAFFYTTWNLKSVGLEGLGECLRHRGVWYLLLGVVEVEANFMIIKAYQYTTVTSVQLLDCLAIPTILILSRCLLKAIYSWQNYVGVVICLTGAGLLVLADFLTGRYKSSVDQTIINSLIGDALVVGGSLLYGALNVAEEIMVGRYGAIEYLSMVGCCASVVSSVQFSLLERHELHNIDFSINTVWICLLIFTACMFLFYSTASYVINATSAMSVNLNLLSSDAFSLAAGILVFKYHFHWLHFISFIIILAGVILYNVYSSKLSSSPPPSSSLSPSLIALSSQSESPISPMATISKASSSLSPPLPLDNKKSHAVITIKPSSSPSSSPSDHSDVNSQHIIVTSL